MLLGLGTWQVARLQWKEALIERTERLTGAEPVPLSLDAPPEEYTPAYVVGGFPTHRTVHVAGTYEGAPGFYVFQPFRPDEGGTLVLVNRGFVASDDRADGYPLPDADRLVGLVRAFEDRPPFAPPPDPGGATAYDRSFGTLTSAFEGLGPFAPLYLDSQLPTELPRGGTTRLDFSNRHLGYAITWYGLAAGLVGVYVAATRREG